MKTIDYILKLLSIPSPTGYTKNIVNYINNELISFGYKPYINNKGSLLVTIEGINNEKHRLITSHLDTLGAMVKSIKSNGRLKINLIGGFSFTSIEGENCNVHLSLSNKVISGSILIHQSSVHVYKDVKTAERNENNIEIRLDEKVNSKEDVIKLGIQVGDFVSFNTRTILTESGFLKSRHLDDKISAGIMLNLLKYYIENDIKLPYTTHFYFSNNEEIGYGANSNIPYEVVEYLAIDMGAIGDDQETDEYSVSICAKDSTGPYHLEFRNHLVNLAIKNNIDYKIDLYPYYGSDASSAMNSGHDIKHALIGSGVESSHSYERTHIESINATEKLIKCYLNSNLVE